MREELIATLQEVYFFFDALAPPLDFAGDSGLVSTALP